MRNYKKFGRVALSLLIGGAVFLGGSIVLRQHIPDEYIGAERAYLSELETLLSEFDSITGKRIALVGSSPVILGLSSEQIEKATGVPTRNLALNSSRGVFPDYVAMVSEHLRPGDVVVIADPNLMKSPQIELPLRCVRHFAFDCMREQTGYAPRIVEDASILFTDRSFGAEESHRNPRGDFVFSGPQKMFPAQFQKPFPRNGAEHMAASAKTVRSRGACPILVLTPFLPKAEEVSRWQNEFTQLWQRIDEAGLRDITVEDSPIWNDPALFHHNEHPSEPGREIWTASVIAKLQEKGLPASCAQINASGN